MSNKWQRTHHVHTPSFYVDINIDVAPEIHYHDYHFHPPPTTQFIPFSSVILKVRSIGNPIELLRHTGLLPNLELYPHAPQGWPEATAGKDILRVDGEQERSPKDLMKQTNDNDKQLNGKKTHKLLNGRKSKLLERR